LVGADEEEQQHCCYASPSLLIPHVHCDRIPTPW
jgi:hypothetical protein